MKIKHFMPPTYLLVSIVVMIILHLLCPVAVIIPLPWNLLGIILLAMGVITNINADKAFREAGTTVKPFEESSALITYGIFRISRNPMYLGFVLVLIGIAILLRSLTPFLVSPVFVILMDRAYISIEEQMLATRFGSRWAEYRKNTRRWL